MSVETMSPESTSSESLSAEAVSAESTSAEPQLSTAADAVEFPYRAISPWAILSLIFAGLALIGLLWWPALVVTFLGIIAAVAGIRSIKKYPDEFSGGSLVMAALGLNLLLLVGGAARHAYIYATEVPDGYERVAFYQLQQPDDAPDVPADLAFEIDGKPVFLKGYIHPLSGSGMLRQFILVPDLGTCCFGGQPKATDMIEVTLRNGQTVRAGFVKKKLAGDFKLNSAAREVNGFENAIYYRMKVDQIK